jgi:hypothetical protein
MNCPVCKKLMTSKPGTQLDPRDGVTVYCPHRDCPAQEISGHVATEKAALAVVMSRRISSEGLSE